MIAIAEKQAIAVAVLCREVETTARAKDAMHFPEGEEMRPADVSLGDRLGTHLRWGRQALFIATHDRTRLAYTTGTSNGDLIQFNVN